LELYISIRYIALNLNLVTILVVQIQLWVNEALLSLVFLRIEEIVLIVQIYILVVQIFIVKNHTLVHSSLGCLRIDWILQTNQMQLAVQTLLKVLNLMIHIQYLLR